MSLDDVRRPSYDDRHYRRGIYLLPSIITVGNMFCGYACVVFAMRNDLVSAAPFIGYAVVLDMLDGRIARMTKTTSAFGLEFDSLADVISFGLAPAVLAFEWGLGGLDRIGWTAGFLYLTATAMRLARFNIQTHSHVQDKRYFVGMPSPAAAGVIAATVYAWPVLAYPHMYWSLVAVLVPAALMVSTVKFRSFKTLNLGWTPSYMKILLVAAVIALVALKPRLTLLAISYGYLSSAFIEMALARRRSRREIHPTAAGSP